LLDVVERRGKFKINIGVNDADGRVLILWSDFEDVKFKLLLESFDGDGIAFMQASEIFELIFQDSFGVV
jgi:hypothetical protein